MTTPTDCVFCQIVARKAPTEIIFDGGDTMFFYDITPQSKIHVIGIPKKHIASLQNIKGDDHLLVGKLLHDVVHVAQQVGLDKGGYRVVTNTGEHAGQAVPHLHFHMLGGEKLGPLNAKRD